MKRGTHRNRKQICCDLNETLTVSTTEHSSRSLHLIVQPVLANFSGNRSFSHPPQYILFIYLFISRKSLQYILVNIYILWFPLSSNSTIHQIGCNVLKRIVKTCCRKAQAPVGVFEWAPLVAQIVKNLPAMQATWVQSLGREESLPRREWLTVPGFLPGEFHGLRSLVGYSPWSHKEPDTTEQLTLSLHLGSRGKVLFQGMFLRGVDVVLK